jgi:flavin reductase (DIM6/NTAB) family NADH-FMN oxidoreductase RutF
MPSTVTLWTAHGRDHRPAGLTVSSTVVAEGTPGQVLGLVDDESDLYAAVLVSGRFAVCVLSEADRQLADQFAGLMPAPGGVFAQSGWDDTAYGPVRPGDTWVGCTVETAERVGYGMLVRAVVDEVHLGDSDSTPLLRHRGRYTSVRTANAS